jgi:hypothetical protein
MYMCVCVCVIYLFQAGFKPENPELRYLRPCMLHTLWPLQLAYLDPGLLHLAVSIVKC